MNYKQLKNMLSRQIKTREHYEELLGSSVSELKFKNLSVDHLYSCLDELETLCEKGVDSKLIGQVIENQKERHHLNKLIHYNLVANGKTRN